MPEATQPGSESMSLLTDTTTFDTPPELKDGPHWDPAALAGRLGGPVSLQH